MTTNGTRPPNRQHGNDAAGHVVEPPTPRPAVQAGHQHLSPSPATPKKSDLNRPKRRRRRRNPQRNPEGTAGKGTAATTNTAGKDGGARRKDNGGVAKQNSKRRNNRQRDQRRSRTNQTRQRSSARPRMETSIETSAGGLVVSGLAEAVMPDGTVDLARLYVALIGRLDRRGRLLWSMPKGHVEAGEAHASTAEREVWEETGVYGQVFAELGVIDYWFVSDGKRIHKTVHHHLLRFLDGDLNDEDPEVTEVAWIPVSELIERLAYADERKLARLAHDMLPELARTEKAEGRITRGERHDNKATVYHTVRLRHHSIRWVRGPGHHVHGHTWWYGSARGGATVPHDTRQP